METFQQRQSLIEYICELSYLVLNIQCEVNIKIFLLLKCLIAFKFHSVLNYVKQLKKMIEKVQHKYMYKVMSTVYS